MANGDPFKHVIPGQPAAFQAAWVNAVSDHLRHGGGPAMPLDSSRISPGILWAYNGTGANVPRFTAIGFSGPVMTPSGDPGSESENGFASRLAVSGESLTVVDYTARFAVFLEPCPAGSVAPAVAWGLAPALVNIGTEGDKYCEADQATGKLVSGDKGSADIIWSECSTGTDVRCIIRIGSPAASGVPDGENDYDLLRWNAAAGQWQLLPSNTASTYQLLQKKADGSVGYDWMRYV